MRRLWRPIVAAGVLVVGSLGLGCLAAAQTRPALAFTPGLIAEGAALAHVGDCAGCHTAEAGRSYAGGRPVGTPFGTIYATNITPDLATGIGRWSLADFDRALRQGVRRDGARLYPAMPYDHYASLTADDVEALYAFMMTRAPVEAAAPRNHLVPPLGFRPLLSLWNRLFFRPKPPPADRGAHLAQALGHCGACHTPRGPLGNEKTDQAFAGGAVDGWSAPALNAASPASSAWTEARLFTYLRTGLDTDHAAAAGPMGPVTHELALAPEADVHAIAAYFAAGMRPAGAPASPPSADRAGLAARAHPAGAALFDGACAACHAGGAPMMLSGRPGLTRGSPLWEEDPRDTLQIMLQGLTPPTADAGPFMPPFADALRDADLAELAAYMRQRFTDRPAWSGLEGAVGRARRTGAVG